MMKTIKNIHIICNNDSLQFVVIGDESIALEKLEELKKTYYEDNKYQFTSEKSYDLSSYWHIHTLDGLIEE